jgi:RNA polymerase sigma factor (sigma-70 family)
VPAATHVTASENEDHDEASQTFAALKPRERALPWLACVEEHSHEQIAGALGIERANVKVLLFRARARLRDLLNARSVPRS